MRTIPAMRVRRYREDMSDEEWRGRFDRAVVLFNAGAFYEAHEDWEALWLEAEGEHRLWLQGLIQIAAAFVHYARGFHASGFHRLMAQAHDKVHAYAGFTEHMDWTTFWDDMQPWIAHGKAVADGAPLRAPALPAPPRIGYEPPYEPRPLPIEPEEGVEA